MHAFFPPTLLRPLARAVCLRPASSERDGRRIRPHTLLEDIEITP